MKIPAVSTTVPAAVSDGHTRRAIVRLLLESGSITAGEIGDRLGLSAAGVRRHLDALIEAGDAEASAAAPWQQVGRGRPAKRYRLTAAGRAKLDHSYDDLASAAMRQLREIGGEEAVRTFARRRIDAILADVAPADGPDDAALEAAAERIATALSKAGYVATTTRVGGPIHGVQICQHHCPVSHVAEEFPNCAKPSSRPWPRCSAPTSSGWRPSSTETAPAPPTYPCRRRPARAHPPPAPKERPDDTHPRGQQERCPAPTQAPLTQEEAIASLGRYGYGWADSDVAGANAQRGLSEAVVRDISAKKNEPDWMLQSRLKALRIFDRKPIPKWGSNLDGIDFDNIKYFVRSTEKQAASWDDLPEDIRNTYDRLGIPEAEKQRLVAGVAAQYESEVIYHQIREDLEAQGVIFLDTDTGLREHPDIFKEYFGTVIPAGDNKFSALNTAVWSGGSFIYVPPGVHVDIPLQAYFRINTENMGQFERTLIIADEGSYVHYVEGCLPAGELITTADGDLRPIESIRVGDFVTGHDGRPHRVTAVQVRDLDGELFTFTPMSPANAFSVTAEHPLLAIPRDEVRVMRKERNGWKAEVNSTKLRSAEPRWIAAKDVAEGDFLIYPKPKPIPTGRFCRSSLRAWRATTWRRVTRVSPMAVSR